MRVSLRKEGGNIGQISLQVWPYAGQPRRDIKFDFQKFSFFSTCMGDPPRGDRQC